MSLEERLTTEPFGKVQYETDAEDIRKAWEAKYRNKINQQVSFVKLFKQIEMQKRVEKRSNLRYLLVIS